MGKGDTAFSHLFTILKGAISHVLLKTSTASSFNRMASLQTCSGSQAERIDPVG